MDNINPRKLHKELENAGINLSGCNSDGLVWDKDNKEIQDRNDVKSIIALHDPTPDQKPILHEKYSKAGVTTSAMVFSLWKKVMASDSSDADSLQSLMDGIDALIN